MTDKGFVLLEVLIAAIVFTIGVVALLGTFGSGLLSSVDAENTMVAMNLAQRRIEEIRNLNFQNGIINEAKADVTGFTGFQREVTVTEPLTDLKQVTVTVYWIFKANEVDESLVTYISKK